MLKNTLSITKNVRMRLVVASVFAMMATLAMTAFPVNAATFAVNSTADTQDANPGNGICETATGNGICTLRAAISEANSLAGADSITLPAGTYTQSLPGTNDDANVGGDWDITTPITINGAGSGTTIIQANALPNTATERVFHCHTAASAVFINDVTIRNGVALYTPVLIGGGGIRVETATSNLTLNRVVVTNNRSEGRGGGIAIGTAGANLTVLNSTVSSNNAGSSVAGSAASGAGIDVTGTGPPFSTVNISNTMITGNAINSTVVSAFGGGASFGALGSTATITGSTFNTNTSTSSIASPGGGFAGGIYNQQATVHLTNCVVMGNSSNVNSGGIRTLSSSGGDALTTITGTTISGNSSPLAGGVGTFSSTSLINARTDIINSTISGNMATSFGGGGVLNSSTAGSGSATTTLLNSTVSGNSGLGGGGLINTGSAASMNLNFCTVASNTAITAGGVGGGIYNSGSSGPLTIKNTIVADNTAPATQGPDMFGTIDTGGYNHVENPADATFVPVGNDVTGSDPQLGVLGNNGGSTFSHLPGGGSPVLNTIPNTMNDCGNVINYDQRSFGRPGGAGCEKGAVEVGGATPTPTATNTPTNTPTITPTNTPTSTATPTATATATPCAATFSYAGPAVVIPDNTAAGVNFTIPVSGLGSISDLNFRFDGTQSADPVSTTPGVNHSWVGDIIVKITSPMGTTVSAFDRPGVPTTITGCNSNNLAQIILDDDGGFPAVEAQCGASNAAAFPIGSFSPNNPLSAFDGQNPNGNWTINISDNAGIDTGAARAFSLILGSGCSTPTATSTPTGTPTSTATGTPSPTATFTPTNTPTNTPTSTPTFTPTPNCGGTFSYTGLGVVIPDNTVAGVNFTIPVSGIASVADLNFRFDGVQSADPVSTAPGINHSFVGDIVVKITSPAGTTVSAFDRPGVPVATFGCSSNNLAEIILDDDGGFPAVETQCATDTTAFPTGSFSPNNALSAFDGQDPNGNWTINISDNAGSDTGMARAFSLVIGAGCTSPTPTSTPTATATPTNTPTSTATATNTPTATPGGTPAISGTITYGNAISGPTPPRFVSNVTVSGAGSPNVSTTTAAPGATAGQYTLTGFGAGSYTVTPSKTGGVNGITSFDAARIAQHVTGASLLTGNALVVADVSGNNSITSFDAANIANFVVVASPAGSTGTWRFYTTPNVPFPPGATATSRTYPSVTTSITGEDYNGLLMGEVSGNWNNTGARPVGSSRSNGSGPERSAAVRAPLLVTPADHDVIVPVSVEWVADKGIISYEFDLRYDPSVIEPQARPVDLAGTVSSKLSVAVGAEEPGLLKVAVYGPMPLDGNGVLLNLRFTAVGAPGSVSPLTWESMMFNEGDPQTTVADGQVELSSAAPNQAEISGRLLTATGQGVPTARVTLTDTAGQSHSILSNGFGVYRFGSLQVGQTYTISVDAKRYTFTPMTVSVTDQLAGVDMIARQ